ncbi:Uncharacterised protein [Mycobacteroides abscessus subsp. abscessus]|nr:Uncharacterised protein [Mycobacteroides abscessus subsp. abscessus]
MATGRYTDSSAVLATPRRSISWWLVAFRPSCIRRCCGGRCLPPRWDFGAAGVRGQLHGDGSASVSDAGSSLQQRALEFSA